MQEDEWSKTREQLIVAQFNRVANDFRQFDQMIWQVPSVAVTLTSFIFAVSLNYVHNSLISGIILLMGGFFDFSLVVALNKHRLYEDVRARYLEEIEKAFNIKHLPLKAEEAENFLAEKSDHTHASFKFFRKKNAFRFLTFSILIFTVSLFGLGVLFIVNYIIHYNLFFRHIIDKL